MRHRLLQRAVLPIVVALATLAGTASVAEAAPAAPATPLLTGRPAAVAVALATPAPRPFLTAVTDRGVAPAWSRFRIVGHLSPGNAGERIVVQRRLAGGRWTEFPAATLTRVDGSYTCAVVSGRRGVNEFRMVRFGAGGSPLVSNTTTIVVS
jgi:hypothetical protein